jgi:hypothetical protein
MKNLQGLTTLNKMAYRNWGVTGKKKMILFLWEDDNFLGTFSIPIQIPLKS